MIRKGYYGGISPRLGRCGGSSPMLTKCNCLAGSRVQSASTRCWGGLSLYSLRQEPAPVRGVSLISRYTNYSIIIVKLYNINLTYFVSSFTIIIIILYSVPIIKS